MVVSPAPVGYTLEVSDAEREALLVALELSLSLVRGDGGARALALDLDAAAVDRLTDRLALAGAGR